MDFLSAAQIAGAGYFVAISIAMAVIFGIYWLDKSSKNLQKRSKKKSVE